MKTGKRKKRLIITSSLVLFVAIVSVIILGPSFSIRRIPFSVPEASSQNWEDILSHPREINLQSYSTGTMQTNLSGIMNLDNPGATEIEDKVIDIPVNICVIQHPEFGSYLIDAGLDRSYVKSQHGTIKGLMVKSFLGKGRQEPGADIAGILARERIILKGIFLTHLHMDHTAGVVDLPKDIPYVVGKGEPYLNFRFFMQSDHLKGLKKLYELNFSEGIELPPLGKAIDVFGDGSFWAISSAGHTKGHVIFLINRKEGPILFTGDACNDHNQFETGIGPGYYSNDTEAAQEELERIIIFKERYPEVVLVYGHDIKRN